MHCIWDSFEILDLTVVQSGFIKQITVMPWQNEILVALCKQRLISVLFCQGQPALNHGSSLKMN